MGSRWEIRPLGLWDRPVTPDEDRRSAAVFRARWDDTLALLLDEIGWLGTRSCVVQVDVQAGDLRRDGMLRHNARVAFPGVKVSFDSVYGPLMYATDRMTTWQANVRAIALGLKALRAVDRYGITSSGEQYRGWTAIAPREHSLTPEQAAELLAEFGGGSADLIRLDANARRRAYRAAAAKHHPDVGGDRDTMTRINAARDLLDAEVRA